MTPTPNCPWCNTPKHVRTSGTSYRAMYCGRCRREFEAEDDGDVGRQRPDTWAEKREEFLLRQQQRRRQR